MRQGRDVAGADQAKKIGKAIPEKRMYDVNEPLMAGRIPSTYIHGIKEALLEKERIGAIGTGKAQPSPWTQVAPKGTSSPSRLGGMNSAWSLA